MIKRKTSIISKYIYALAGAALATMLLMPQLSFASDSHKWIKVCSGTGDKKVCNIVKDVMSSYGQPLAIFTIIESKSRKVLQVTVPTGRHIYEGVTFQLGNKDVKKLYYSYCLGPNCVAQSEIDDKIIDDFKKSDKIKITSINFQGEANPIETSLDGFAKAYDSKGISEEEFLRQRQDAAKKALNNQKASIEKLLEAQKQVIAK